MTDLEKFMALYKGFGIDCIVTKTEQNQLIVLSGYNDASTKSDKFGGYNGFYSVVEFDLNGKFLSQDFYE